MTRKEMIAVTLAVAAMIGLAAPAGAHAPAGRYGAKGFHWLARFTDYAVLWVTSNSCNQQELDADQTATNTTKNVEGQREWKTRWPSGLSLERQNCTGKANPAIDLRFKYLAYSTWMDTHGNGSLNGQYGGENHSAPASAEYCAMWGARHPCGTHYATIHINKDRYYNQYDAYYRKHLLLHETGHSMGMQHHCSSGSSVMRTGQSTCSATMGYSAHDRLVVRDDIYPNWPYN
ncbi:MAG TPA: hypothetical protein VGB64_12815 [Actinomycetota bacterium]